MQRIIEIVAAQWPRSLRPPSAMSKPAEAIPTTWEERALKAWEYYAKEPLVKSWVNSWLTFAVGDS